jgi:hypothetical protein
MQEVGDKRGREEEEEKQQPPTDLDTYLKEIREKRKREKHTVVILELKDAVENLESEISNLEDSINSNSSDIDTLQAEMKKNHVIIMKKLEEIENKITNKHN